MNTARYLNELKPHECGFIDEVEAPDSDLERLMAMGVCGGRSVEVVQQGDPLIIKVYGTRVGLSKRLAKKIRMSSCFTDSCVEIVPKQDVHT